MLFYFYIVVVQLVTSFHTNKLKIYLLKVDGKVVDQLVGASKDQLYALLYKYYSSNSSSSSSYPSTSSGSSYRYQ